MAYKSTGVNNGGANVNGLDKGDALDLFEKKMMTDVLGYFQDTNVMKELIMVKSIDSGKSASFPVVGNVDAEIHPNDNSELDTDNGTTTERIIVIEGMFVAKDWITDLDEAMTHYDPKSPKTKAIGRSLAKKYDKKALETVIAAGAIVDTATAASHGLKEFDDDIFTSEQSIALASITNGAQVYASMLAAQVEYSEKDIVGDPSYVLRPASYYALLNNPANTGLTWVNDENAQSGKVPAVLGHKVYKSPHFPAGTGTAGAIAAGDVVGVLFAEEAVGALELVSTSVRTDYIPLRLSTLIVGKMAYGMDVLNHGAAINIKAA